MRKFNTYSRIVIVFTGIMVFFSSCEKFFDPEQDLKVVEDQMYDDWYEYRSIEMGMYALQQQLVEQIIVLGELRGDLLTVTNNASVDLIEINNFNISKTNKYASPTNFFKLIAACNHFIQVLKTKHPEVLDMEEPVNNFDKLYGEALCMRAWAYFYAVRIYGRVPFIHESLATMEEIEQYINSPGTYIDSVYIDFDWGGYYNDTLYNHPIELEKKLYDTKMIIDYFTNQLEYEVKDVGVNHYYINNDETWEITIWNRWAMRALLGLMYLTDGNYAKAIEHFEPIIYNYTEEDRYQLLPYFGYNSWVYIFTGIDNREHIYTIWFDKTNFQQNILQELFEIRSPHKYMLKPTSVAIDYWETEWRGQQIRIDPRPWETEMTNVGFPSDFYRGVGRSYMYWRGALPITDAEYVGMLTLRADGDMRSSRAIMEGIDTVVYKYSIGKDLYDQDANFTMYRAGGIHLYIAECYTWWEFESGGEIKPSPIVAVRILNDGDQQPYGPSSPQMGVRGRIGLGNGYDGVQVSDILYIHDPYTNEVIGYRDLEGNLLAKQLHLEEEILNERVRELAYEGERFYDLIRVAKRRWDHDPTFLARKVSAKYPEYQRQEIFDHLSNEENWYIKYFE